MPASPDLCARLRRLIAAEGPIPLDRFMAEANAHYYATRDPLGAAGDFVTAPEISQMFGELVGLCLADLWRRAGSRAVAYVELGPGRGTLAADALRAMAGAGLTPPVELVETSPVLRAAQRRRLPSATWHDAVDTLPRDVPLLIVANEFFDALGVRQFARTEAGWRERMVGEVPGGFELLLATRVADADIPPHLRHAPVGAVAEASPAAGAIVEALSRRLVDQGGVLLFFDYGHSGGAGDTFQAVRGHRSADPLRDPGESDLTAHVDFRALADAAAAAGARAIGPVEQGQWLVALGIAMRAAALARAAPARSDEIAAAYRRLTDPQAMGRLFKAGGIVPPGWPDPAGLA